ncbi:MAG: TonB-dependent receptor plug domain-containing protein, partial [Leeuwenhoekiella sp.]
MIQKTTSIGIFHFRWSQQKWLSSLLFLLLPILTLMAQQGTEITGTVISATSNSPIPGANVLVKGTNTGAFTDFDGNFSIIANSNDVLVFSYVGFQSSEVPVGSQTTINVSLEEGLSALDEVVVVGYGTQRKSDLTGSIAVIDAEEAQKVSNSDISQLLQGRSAGVTVTSDGQPGAAPNVRIRGVATFGDNQPLYIVDGVPVGTSIRDFNPNDIKTIQILKDASAGAIYGSRAANGVVIITTKT